MKDRLPTRRIATVIGAAGLLFALNGMPKDTSPARAGDPTPTPSGSMEPSAAPSGAPEASPFTPTETRPGWQRIKVELLDGTTIQADQNTIPVLGDLNLDTGAVISGDVTFGGKDGTKLFDSDALSGLIVLNKQANADFHATWGATVLENYDPSKQDVLLQTLKAQMQETGCDKNAGCSSVVIKEVEQDGTIKDYTQSVEPSPSASATPSPTESLDINNLSDHQLLEEILKATLAEEDILKAIQNCTCNACQTEKPTPSATATPAATCPPSKDVEHAYTGWNTNGILNRAKAPKDTETDVTRAILQGDDAWRINGSTAWHTNYDSNAATAQITVYEFAKPTKLDTSFDWGGDLQIFPSCNTEQSFTNRLQSDINETFNRPEIKSIQVTYVTTNGTHSVTINKP